MKQILFILSLCIGFQSFSQGCGDAGACSIDAMKNGDKTNPSTNAIKAGNTLGIAQYGVFIVSPYLEYRRKLSERLSFSTKLSSALHTGKLASTYDLSDFYLVGSYYATPNLKILAGVKIPFNKANKMIHSISLPMSYQSTLGSTDLILGVLYDYKHFSYSIAYQKVLIQNSNGFRKDDYSFEGIDTNYISTMGYHRESDVLLRVSYRHRPKKRRYQFVYSMLPIFHLGRDSYLNESGERIKIEDSQGLTLNINIFYRYQLSINKYFEFSFGAPLIARPSRPDGLTSVSLGVEYVILF